MNGADYKIRTEKLNLYYGAFRALKDVSIAVRPRAITALIGPSGCGKSTLLRSFNRSNELIAKTRLDGCVWIDQQDIYRPGVNLTNLRKRIGMVFQRPNPFPLSVRDNLTYGLRVHGLSSSRQAMEDAVAQSLRATDLWDDLKDRLDRPALSLSPEQQQRLCISRVLAVGPDVLLMDAPCSALDPVATERIEELMRHLAQRYTVVSVTHNLQQAARVSRETGFMWLGELVEMGPTQQIFTNPKDPRTEDYVTGRYG